MPQFHETRMGVKFFEVDLPRIIDALEKLAGVQPTNRPDPYKAPEPTVQTLNRHLKHMNLDERLALFETISRGYCTECGRPHARSATEIACTCTPKLKQASVRYVHDTLQALWRRIEGTNFQDQLTDAALRELVLISSGYLVGNGVCTDPENCPRCKGNITKPHAGIPS